MLPLSGLVLKNPTITEARAPLVIKVLFPFRMYSSPSFTAVARMAPGSDPAFGSVRAKAANLPGFTMSAKYFPCSGVPARITFRSATKEVTKLMAYPASTLASSSKIMAVVS